MKNEYLGHPLVSSSFVHEHFSPALKQEKVKKVNKIYTKKCDKRRSTSNPNLNAVLIILGKRLKFDSLLMS